LVATALVLQPIAANVQTAASLFGAVIAGVLFANANLGEDDKTLSTLLLRASQEANKTFYSLHLSGSRVGQVRFHNRYSVQPKQKEEN
jgi:hypothetical protein